MKIKLKNKQLKRWDTAKEFRDSLSCKTKAPDKEESNRQIKEANINQKESNRKLDEEVK